MEQQTETTQDQESKHFGHAFEQFGEQMAAWGEEFGRQMEVWGEEFGHRMEAWGKEFGPRMEAWSEKLAEKMEHMGEHVEKWFEERTTSPPANAEKLREERLAILRMIEEGKITVTEAESLLRALGE